MTDVTLLLKKYESLIRATTVKYTRAFRPSRHIGSIDDYVAEATIAAWKAIETYRNDKATKLETYMIGCIKNRMIDLDRTANRGGRPELAFCEAIPEPEDEADDSHGQVEQRITFSRVLSEDECKTLYHFLDGGSVEQLLAARCRNRDEKRMVRLEITTCLHRIRHKLQSHGLSLSV